MSEKSSATRPRTAQLLGASIVVFVLAAIGSGLSVALGVHGFGRGMLIGAALACVALGGVLLGLALTKGRRSAGASDWLPSRDNAQ